MAWHTDIKYWEVCAKLNTCLLKAYVFAVQTATQASQATGSQQKPQTQQKTPSRGFPQGNSALLPIARPGHFCKLNMFWSFSICTEIVSTTKAILASFSFMFYCSV